ncbi:MAG: repeat-containing protein [Nitrospirae bacterium]|nr:repeat-containing protein [Nitrospirota bacterium]
MCKLIQVRYRNQRESTVDDVTLNELILTGKIKQFYRPSEGRWVDIDYDKVRMTKTSGYEGTERREHLQQKKQVQKPEGFLSRLLNRKPEEEKPLTAQDWFERGFNLLHTTGDTYEAIRAFASSLELDSSNARAYLNRGMAYERMNNVQQAFEDYSRAIQLLPQDGKLHYIRGMLLWRYGLETEAVEDMKASALLRYRLAIDFLTQKGIAYD